MDQEKSRIQKNETMRSKEEYMTTDISLIPIYY